jgi:hypothetical protein
VAGLAGGGGLVFGELLAHPGALGLEHAAVEVADHAFERLLDVVALAAVDEGERDGLALGAVEDDVGISSGSSFQGVSRLKPN